MGAYVGDEGAALAAATDNPKGFWERRDTVASNDAILAAAGCAWDQLASWSFRPVRDEWATPATIDAMKAALVDLDTHQPWVLKDPRLCLTLPFWQPLLRRPVAVVVARNPAEIATSLRTRNGISLAHALAVFEYSAVGVLINTRGFATVRVSYEEALADPAATVARLKRELEAHGVTGLHDADAGEVMTFVDRTLHRSKPATSEVDGLLSPRIAALDAALRGNPHTLPDPIEPSLLAVTTMEVRRQVARERAYIQAVEHQLAAGRDEREALRAALSDARGEFERDFERQRSEWAAEIASLRAVVADREAERGEFMRRAAVVAAERDAVRMHLDAIHATKTWRWSRTLARLIGYGRG
jgi:hypothetical protein